LRGKVLWKLRRGCIGNETADDCIHCLLNGWDRFFYYTFFGGAGINGMILLSLGLLGVLSDIFYKKYEGTVF
jgi:hypothetical protein